MKCAPLAVALPEEANHTEVTPQQALAVMSPNEVGKTPSDPHGPKQQSHEFLSPAIRPNQRVQGLGALHHRRSPPRQRRWRARSARALLRVPLQAAPAPAPRERGERF